MNRDSPSLVVGATNPLFTNATNLAGAALPTLVTPTRSLPVPPVIPSSAANTDIPMTPSGPVLLSDNNHSDFRPSASPGRTGFGSFSPHANPTNQSGSDRSDAQDSSSTHSCASPRSTLPAPRRPVPQVSLLSNVTNFLDASPNPAADPPVPDISSPMPHLSLQAPSTNSFSVTTDYIHPGCSHQSKLYSRQAASGTPLA